MYPFLIVSLLVSIIFFSNRIIAKRSNMQEVIVISYAITCLFCIILSSLYGWRVIGEGFGGLDAGKYKLAFESLSVNYLEAMSQLRYEKGYATLFWFSKATMGEFAIFQFFYFLILLFLYKKITDRLPLSIYSLLAYFLISFFLIISFNLSRMVLGLFILFFIVEFLKNESYGKAMFVVFIASTMQATFLWGVVMVLYYYLYKKISSRLVFFGMYLVSILLAFQLVETFKILLVYIDYGHYIERQKGVFSIGNYVFLTVVIFTYFTIQKNNNTISPFSKVIFILLPSMFYVVPLYSAINIAYRFNFIYILFFAFLIPDMFKVFTNSRMGFLGGFLLSVIPLVYVSIKVYNFYSRDVLSSESWEILDNYWIF
jgi:hypothetical protein